MKSRIIIAGLVTSLISLGGIVAQEMTIAWVGCDGTVVSRTEAGKLDVFTTDKNLPGCQGPKWVDTAVSNMDYATGADILDLIHTGSSIGSQNTGYDPKTDGVLLDLAQTDMVEYRIQLMRERQIKYANAIRSLRMRNAANMQSKTNAYLMQDDAVVATGSGGAWTAVEGAIVSVTNEYENTIEADTTGKADGYIATRLLRDPNASDLVRIRQADQQFWSDVARVNVAHSVNVRSHPWYGAKILSVLTDDTPVYIVSTIDNWSEVISDDRTLHGYVRSDYLTIDKKQRVEIEPLLK